jgi:hypothetical protein
MKNCTSSLHPLKAHVQTRMSRIAVLLAIVLAGSFTNIIFQGTTQMHPHPHLASGIHLVEDHDPWD